MKTKNEFSEEEKVVDGLEFIYSENDIAALREFYEFTSSDLLRVYLVDVVINEKYEKASLIRDELRKRGDLKKINHTN